MESSESDGLRVRGKKKIQVSAATLVDLKAALFQKQQQVRKEKAAQQHDTALPREVSDKTSSIWRKAAPLKYGRKPATAAALSQVESEKCRAEEAEYERSRRALEAKVALYDRLSKGQGLQEALEGDGEEEEDGRYMVDFTRKAYEEMLTVNEREEGGAEEEESKVAKDGEREAHREQAGEEAREGVTEEQDAGPGEEWVDYVDALGRSRKCLAKDLPHIMALDRELKEKAPPPPRSPSPELLSEDMRRDRERREWERRAGEEVSQDRPIGPVHYQDVYPGEIRSHGVGYFAFSADEEKRGEQMNLLSKLRDQTLDQRQKRELMKEKRKVAMEARLSKVRQRKLKQEEGEGDGGKVEGIADLDFGEKQEVNQADVIATEIQKMREEVERQKEAERVRQEEEKRARHVRPWDKGKVDFIKRRKQELEDERPAEFAPPQTYAKPGGFKEKSKLHTTSDTTPTADSQAPSSTHPPPQAAPFPPPETAPFSPPQAAPFPPPQAAPFPPPQAAPFPPPQAAPFPPPETAPFPPPQAAQFPPPQAAQYPYTSWPPFAAPMYYMYPGMYGGYMVPGYYGMSQPGTGMGQGQSSGNGQPMQGQMWPPSQSSMSSQPVVPPSQTTVPLPQSTEFPHSAMPPPQSSLP